MKDQKDQKTVHIFANREAEQCVIGAALLDPSILATLAPALSPSDFYFIVHQNIYAAMLDMAARGEGIDYITVMGGVSHIKAKQKEIPREERMEFEDFPIDYLAEMADLCPGSCNFGMYARRVLDMSRRRHLRTELFFAMESLDDVNSSDVDVDATASRLQVILDEFGSQKKNGVCNGRELARLVMERMDVGKNIKCVPTGFDFLDRCLGGGLRAGHLIIVGARTSHGKTSFAANVAANAITTGKKVLFFSAEMSRESVSEMFFQILSKMNLHHVMDDHATDAVYNSAIAASKMLAESPLFVEDTPAISADTIRAVARNYVHKHGVEMVIVDYLQLLGKPADAGRHDTREQIVASTSRAMKTMARELDIPVLMLAQLNREIEKRPNGKPRLSDLRESGACEQDADEILLLQRPPRERRGSIEVAKQRQGPCAEFLLEFDGPTQRFFILGPSQENAAPGQEILRDEAERAARPKHHWGPRPAEDDDPPDIS